jgi:p21-activated kinase 1
MDSASASSRAEKPHGRRLSKKPPPSRPSGASPLLVSPANGAAFSATSRSTGSIHRTPSAPVHPRDRSTHGRAPGAAGHQRTPTSPNPETGFSSSSSSLDKQNPSSKYAPLQLQHDSSATTLCGDYYSPQYSYTSFDSRPISGRLSEESTSPGSYEFASKRNTSRRPPPPLQLSSDQQTMAASTTSRPPLRQSNSFTAGDRGQFSMKQVLGAPGSKRNSAEAKPSSTGKKGGFSRFMSGVLGSPKRVEISSPSNPVHLTHVGFNFVTGEFTVLVSPCTFTSSWRF